MPDTFTDIAPPLVCTAACCGIDTSNTNTAGAPVSLHIVDQLVEESAISTGSEPQHMAVRWEAWRAIRGEVEAEWRAAFAGDATAPAEPGGGGSRAAGGGGRRQRAAQQQQQQHPPDAAHLLSVLRQPVTTAIAAAAAEAASGQERSGGGGRSRRRNRYREQQQPRAAAAVAHVSPALPAPAPAQGLGDDMHHPRALRQLGIGAFFQG
jgi:hypothetical protein